MGQAVLGAARAAGFRESGITLGNGGRRVMVGGGHGHGYQLLQVYLQLRGLVGHLQVRVRLRVHAFPYRYIACRCTSAYLLACLHLHGNVGQVAALYIHDVREGELLTWYTSDVRKGAWAYGPYLPILPDHNPYDSHSCASGTLLSHIHVKPQLH